MDERVYLKVKIKSLGEEARIIRKETKKATLPSIKNGLYRHRIDVVRVEARHTHLAYGFLRGREYRQIEHGAKTKPDWKKVRRMVEKYGSHKWWDMSTESYAVYEQRCKQAKKQLEETLARFDKWVEQAESGNIIVDEAVNGSRSNM